MAKFGSSLNPFRKAVAKFARAGKPFKSAWPTLKGIPNRPPIRLVRRMYREATAFHANRAFWENASPRALPGVETVTPTVSLLKMRYQYIFSVKVKYAGESVYQQRTVSFLSNRRYTKGSAEAQMGERLQQLWGNLYERNISYTKPSMTGIKQSAWDV